MSLWWVQRDQLDEHQAKLIEDLPLQENHLVLGPPGSGKTNVLLRRAQFARSQDMPNALVLAYTRSLTEFIKTGCFDPEGREIFPRQSINTIEGWIRALHDEFDRDLPNPHGDYLEQKAARALSAASFAADGRLPKYDVIFVDEAQDLLAEEVALLEAWADVVFFVGDDRQKIYRNVPGLDAVRAMAKKPKEHMLPFHYRLAPAICNMADRIQKTGSGQSLENTSLYRGPRPGHVLCYPTMGRQDQVLKAAEVIEGQFRVYGDMIRGGDLLGVIVPRRADRDYVAQQFQNTALRDRFKVIRARSEEEDGYDPSFSPQFPIVILTEAGSKGLEFRAVHWLFADENDYVRTTETYYTVVSRAKTSLEIYRSGDLPHVIARSYSPPPSSLWGAS